MFCRNCGKEVPNEAIMCVGCGVPPKNGKKFCPSCGGDTQEAAEMCTKCGVGLTSKKSSPKGEVGEKSWTTTLLLAIFLGVIGGHRFYTGHTGIGVVQLFTGGGCGIWTIIDIIGIVSGSFKDSDGKLLEK